MALAAGSRLGPFEIVGPLGAGGMGEVYRAHDARLGRDVAIKILPTGLAGDPDRLARFEREARTLASLNHPRIAAIYGLEEVAGARALVLELVEGETLADRLRTGRMPVEDALAAAQQIAEALEAAHERGIVHRDLKPANIKITPDGVVKVLDFGLAKAVQGDSSPGLTHSPTITAVGTRDGVILGTAAYMSPEQARGRTVDRRTDLWAFGAVLYEMLVGVPAFGGDNVSDTLALVLTAEPDWSQLPASTPDTVVRLIRRCLQKDRGNRLDSATAARLEIVEALTGPTPTSSRSGAPAARPSRTLRAALAGLIAGLALAVTGAWMLMRPAPPRPAEVSRLAIVPSPSVPLVIAQGWHAIAVSADGRYLAYTSGNITGEGPLMLRALDQLEAESVTGAEQASEPFFSPDAQWIGFVEAGYLKKVPRTGGEAITLCRKPGLDGSTWLEDDTIVFGAGLGAGLARVPAAGGNVTSLTTVDRTRGERDHVLPVGLPDDRGVLFTVRVQDGSSDVAVVSLADGRSKVLVRSASDAQFIPRSESGGRHGYLVYHAEGVIRGVPFDLERLEVTGDPAPLLPSVAHAAGTGIANYAVSRTGILFYVPAESARRSLVWVDRQGRETVLPVPEGPYSGTRLSPDGRHATIVGQPGFWTFDFARESLMRLSPAIGLHTWMPDSRRFLFTGRVGEMRGVFEMAADGSGAPRHLAEAAGVDAPNSVTLDGKYLIGSRLSSETSWDVVRVPLSGAQTRDEGRSSPAAAPEVLVQTPAQDFGAMISPDGRYLAYQSAESGRYEIYVRPYPGVNEGRWQISTGGGQSPAWSRRGAELFYLAPPGALMSSAVQTTPAFTAAPPVKVLDGAGYFNSFLSFDVAPDGQRFLMLKKSDSPPNVVVVLDWVDELRRLMPE